MNTIIQFKNLEQFPELTHGVATTTYGNMSFVRGGAEEVKHNRRRFFTDLSIPEDRVVVTSLPHEDTITDVTETDRGKGVCEPDTSLVADILITNKPDTFLFLVVADCLALFLFEPEKRVIGLAHAGWKGVEAYVPEKTVNHMIKIYGCDPDKIRVGISPAITKESQRFVNPVQLQMPGWEPYLEQRGDLHHIDFIGYAIDQLKNCGVKPENIEDSHINTYTDRRFYSHRRSDETGEPEARFGCVIGLKHI